MSKSPILVVVVALASILGSAMAAAAKPPGTTIATRIHLDDCSQSGNVEDGGISVCSGYNGMRVVIAEGDLRQFVSFGPDAEEQPAAEQTLPVNNSLFAPGSQDADIYWRVETAGAVATPLAAIVRFHTETEAVDGVGGRGEVLVVIRLAADGNGGVCHVGYIDGQANSDAMVLAERVADSNAAGFDCAAMEPKVYGAAGAGPSSIGGD